ncbi:alpha/beta-hydrolase [Schizophyllum commune H4-8]|uniref:AB hydrolase-1 domain-containing protein n=1 Tax=Schizophyllum commune (strain H4-8 / FGSC 9210) TaxID=578458 RepID=D8PQY9_SCHCM|nr:alpha/beta-hydrolase [Schizophyllum commune H4-8]KAI5893700.1 alpha/beta-hydrolase [Schizophyllum commune H4-8]
MHRQAKLSTGRTYHFVDELPPDYEHGRTPVLLCIHGFPDLWYGWRNQIKPWRDAGYRVVVPDMLGYGGTDKPHDAAEYTTKKLCNDLAALLDLLDVRKAVFIGHDWGAYVVGRFALWHPQRLLALVIISVPYMPRPPAYVSLDEMIKKFPNWAYQGYLNSPQSMDFIEAREQRYYVQEFSKGMRGPTNYYRTTKLRFDEEQAANLPTSLPEDLSVLLLWGTKDRSTPPQAVAASSKFVPRLQDVALEGGGHWLMLEKPELVTAKVLEWLDAQGIKGKRKGAKL